MSDALQIEIKRWALDTSDWLWGTVQGSWNEKQTTSQIIVDAVIGMIPLIGDVTAARDLIHVGTGLSTDEKKREDVLQWALFVVLLFALIPVIGGVIKGIGRLLLKMGKTAADQHQLLHDAVMFLNRIGRGNAVRFIKELDLLKYQREIIAKSDAFCDRMIEALQAIRDKLDWFIPPKMAQLCEAWIVHFTQLKRIAARQIPRGMRELNERLKLVQQQVYKGEWHEVVVGQRNVTREAEARLVEDGRVAGAVERKGFPKNNPDTDFIPREGWPHLNTSEIEAFSGPITPVLLRGPMKIYRIIQVEMKNSADPSRLARPWWTAELPTSGRQWREKCAVLDDWNGNGHYIEYSLAPDKELKAWKGTASSQKEGGQFLPGGAKQLYLAIDEALAKELKALKPMPTGWTDLTGIGYSTTAGTATTVALAKNEIASKRIAKGNEP